MTGRYCFHRCLSVKISGGYPISGLGRGVSHLRSGGTPCLGGTPCPRGVPHFRGYPILGCTLCPGGTPSQFWLWGYPIPGWGYPISGQGVPRVPPYQDLRWGIPPPRPGMGYPLPRPGMEYPLPTPEMGYPST